MCVCWGVGVGGYWQTWQHALRGFKEESAGLGVCREVQGMLKPGRAEEAAWRLEAPEHAADICSPAAPGRDCSTTGVVLTVACGMLTTCLLNIVSRGACAVIANGYS